MKQQISTIDYGAIGLKIVEQAKLINHQRHLAGEIDPPWSECVQAAQNVVLDQLRNGTCDNRPKGK